MSALPHRSPDFFEREIAALRAERDTLTAELATVKYDKDHTGESLYQLGVVHGKEAVEAELRSVKQAVKCWQQAIGDPEATAAAESALIGLARSWETEQ